MFETVPSIACIRFVVTENETESDELIFVKFKLHVWVKYRYLGFWSLMLMTVITYDKSPLRVSILSRDTLMWDPLYYLLSSFFASLLCNNLLLFSNQAPSTIPFSLLDRKCFCDILRAAHVPNQRFQNEFSNLRKCCINELWIYDFWPLEGNNFIRESPGSN